MLKTNEDFPYMSKPEAIEFLLKLSMYLLTAPRENTSDATVYYWNDQDRDFAKKLDDVVKFVERQYV